MDVIALGAIVESEDLTAPPRLPKLDEGGYVRPWTPEEFDAYLQARDRVFAEDYVYTPDPPELDAASAAELMRELESLGIEGGYCKAPPEMMMAEQRKMLESGELSLYAEEFADMNDGRRVILKDDRGWSLRPNHYPSYPDSSWKFTSGRKLAKEAILVLDPDDNERWIEWVIERLRFLGIDVDPASVHAAPFKIEFGPRVRHELRQRKSSG